MKAGPATPPTGRADEELGRQAQVRNALPGQALKILEHHRFIAQWQQLPAGPFLSVRGITAPFELKQSFVPGG